MHRCQICELEFIPRATLPIISRAMAHGGCAQPFLTQELLCLTSLCRCSARSQTSHRCAQVPAGLHVPALSRPTACSVRCHSSSAARLPGPAAQAAVLPRTHGSARGGALVACRLPPPGLVKLGLDESDLVAVLVEPDVAGPGIGDPLERVDAVLVCRILVRDDQRRDLRATQYRCQLSATGPDVLA